MNGRIGSAEHATASLAGLSPLRFLRTLAVAVALSASSAAADDKSPDWLAAAAKAGEVDAEPYRARVAEILADLNAARRDFAGLPALEWDAPASEGVFRHARWLVHNMREPWNAGKVANFHREPEGTPLWTKAGSAAAHQSTIAFRYLRPGKPFEATERWIPTVNHRLSWFARSARVIRLGWSEGVVAEGEFAGRKWGVLVVACDRAFPGTSQSPDKSDAEPVVCPRDGADRVPVELVREVPDIVPEAIDRVGADPRRLGFPLTFTWYAGQRILPGAEAALVRLPAGLPPGDGKKRPPPPAKKGSAAKGDPPPTPVECYVSTPAERPLRGGAEKNENSVVVFPVAPLEPGARYRATLKATIRDADGTDRPVELTTTFTTAVPEATGR